MDFNNELLIQIAWVSAAILLIFGLKLVYSKFTRGSSEAKMLVGAESIIIVPGYGMAVARAHHEVWELAGILRAKGVRVSFAINPVAGRMPGHMNILLDEAGVPNDVIHDLEEINDRFSNCDIALVVGANDTVNPLARTDAASPIYGMPILNADKARKVFIIKRDQGAGFAGIENPLFSQDNALMCFGDARDVTQKLIADIKAL